MHWLILPGAPVNIARPVHRLILTDAPVNIPMHRLILTVAVNISVPVNINLLREAVIVIPGSLSRCVAIVIHFLFPIVQK